MPRRIHPRWGDDGVSVVPEFCLLPAALEEFAALLRLTDPDAIAILKDFLEEIGPRYLRWWDQEEGAPRVAEQNAAIAELIEAGERLVWILGALDHASESRVADTLLQYFPSTSTGHFTLRDLRSRLMDVMTATKVTLRRGKKMRGPRRRDTLCAVIDEIATFYEKVSGQPFTHSPNVKNLYDGAPQSLAGCFVSAFFKFIQPELPFTAVSGAMAEVVKKRRQRGRKESSPSRG